MFLPNEVCVVTVYESRPCQDLPCFHGPRYLKEEGRGVWELSCLRLECLLGEIVMEDI